MVHSQQREKIQNSMHSEKGGGECRSLCKLVCVNCPGGAKKIKTVLLGSRLF
jgi:hypothetical protein